MEGGGGGGGGTASQGQRNCADEALATNDESTEDIAFDTSK